MNYFKYFIKIFASLQILLVAENKASPEELAAAQQEFAAAQQAQSAAEMKAQFTDISSLELQVEQARSAVDTARSAVEKGKIKSPIDGVVLQVFAKSGSYAQMGCLYLQ